jgi:hypothetical protein
MSRSGRKRESGAIARRRLAALRPHAEGRGAGRRRKREWAARRERAAAVRGHRDIGASEWAAATPARVRGERLLLQGSGHWWLHERPDEAAAALQRFRRRPA